MLTCMIRRLADRLPVQRAAEPGRLPVGRPGPARVPLPSRGQQPRSACMHALCYTFVCYTLMPQDVIQPWHEACFYCCRVA